MEKTDNLTVFDPCCGGGYALTVLGLLDNSSIGKIFGSDVDNDMVCSAKKNMELLTYSGLAARKVDILHLY